MQARKLSEIMTPDVITVTPHAPLQEAARKMADNDIGWLAVVDEDRRLAGTLTDRDIVIRGVAKGLPAREARVLDVMTPGVIGARENQSMDDVARMMQDHQVRRIVIVDSRDQPVGVVSLGDLAKRTHDEHVVSETMEQVAATA